MKKFFKFYSCLLLLAFAVSCGKEIPINEAIEENSFQNESASHLISASLISKTSASEAVAEAARNLPSAHGYSITGKLQDYSEGNITKLFSSEYFGTEWTIETYRIIYSTKGADNDPIMLSGDISFLNETTGSYGHEIGSVYFFNPTFCCDDPKEGSVLENSTMLLEPVVLPLRALFNELVIYPHNQGAGYDKGKNPATPTEYIANARQDIDLELAAFEFLEEKGIKMASDYYTQVVGSSNGAGSALAFQYLLEAKNEYKEAAAKIRLNGTFCGEGCYAPSNVFLNLIRDREALLGGSMYDRLPYIYTAVVYGEYFSHLNDFEDVELTDFFSEEFNNYRVDGTTPILDIYKAGEIGYIPMLNMKEWGFSIANVINDNLYNEGVLNEESKAVKALKKALKYTEEFAKDWTPKSPLTIVHSSEDEFNPYSDANELYNNLSNGGRNKNLKFRTIPYLDHETASTIEMFELFLLPNPSDM